MTQPITVVAVDDHPLIRAGIRTQLEAAVGLELVAEGTCGDDVLRLVRRHAPHVLLLDMRMPLTAVGGSRRSGDPHAVRDAPAPVVDAGGLPLGRFQIMPTLRRLHRQYPATRVIVVSQYISQALLEGAVTRGVNGYLLKDDVLTLSLPQAVRTVYQGGFYFSAGISRRLFAHDAPPGAGPGGGPAVTRRQKQILLAIAEQPDLTYAEHARLLGITEGALKNRLSELFRRLGVKNITGCVIEAIRLGIINIDDG